MGTEDMARQALNVFRMRLLGADVRERDVGQRARSRTPSTTRCATGWASVEDSYYLLGSALGPHPYPLMVREFQSVIGQEARAQVLAQTGRLPDAVVACVGGGSNAIGIFDAFIDDPGVRLIGVEAGGEAITQGRHAARFAGGAEGVLQGTRTWLLQDADGNIEPTHSVSAGLDYAAVGPEHAWLRATGRAEYRVGPMTEPRSTRSSRSRGSRASAGAGVGPRRWRISRTLAPALGPGRGDRWSISRAAATRTSRPWSRSGRRRTMSRIGRRPSRACARRGAPAS